MDYLLHTVIVAAIYVTLALSLDLLAGQAGMLSVGQAAFFGLGAYSSALLSLKVGLPFLGSLGAAMTIAALASLAVFLPTLRLRDDSFVVATFAFQMVVFSVLNNWTELTHGPQGIAGIPRPVILGWTVSTLLDFALLSAVLAGGAFLLVGRIAGSPLGRVLRALREDDLFTESVGKNTHYFKACAAVISAVIAGAAGSMYAHFATYVDPTSFTILESVLVLAMVIVGGTGSRWGPLTGAVVLIVIPEFLRFAGLPTAIAANLRQVFYGASLIVMMFWRPRGLIGRYGFVRR